MSKINGKKVSKQNLLHDVVDWNVDNITFADPEFSSIEQTSGPTISFVRINMLTQNHKQTEEGKIETDEKGNPLNDDSIGELNLGFDRMFSFGVQETTSQETGAVTGHSMSFALWSREGATERDIKTTRKIEAIIQKCKEQVLAVRGSEPMKKIKKSKLEMSDLKDMDKLLYWKTDENDERVPGQGPTFSPKLIEYKARKDPKTGKEKPYQMATIFYLENEVDENGEPLEVSPLEFLSTKTEKKYCYARPVVKFESIFIGAKVISIQCKLTESDVAPVQSGPQRLLHGRHKVAVSNKVSINTSKGLNPLLTSVPHTEEKEEQKASSPKDSKDLDTEASKEKESTGGELSDDPPTDKPKKKIVKTKKTTETTE